MRILARVLAFVGLSLASAALVTLTASANASTCGLDPLPHCYAYAATIPPTIDGIASYIDPDCLSVPSNNAITDEVWLADASTNWVEGGYVYNNGLSLGGLTTNGVLGFWADQRPGAGGYHAWALVNNPPLTHRIVSVRQTSSSTFIVNFDGHFGYSTGNTQVPFVGIIGSETTDPTTTAHSYGFFGSMMYRSAGPFGGWSSSLYNPSSPPGTGPEHLTWNVVGKSAFAGAYC